MYAYFHTPNYYETLKLTILLRLNKNNCRVFARTKLRMHEMTDSSNLCKLLISLSLSLCSANNILAHTSQSS
jgi:hypothetical protein